MNKLSKGLIKADIITAEQCIRYYDKTGVKDIKNVAAYHLQQAVEKIIKLQIYQSGLKYDEAQVYSHNLRNLYRYAVAIGLELTIPETIKEHLDMITKWEAGSRYDLRFSIRIDVLRKYHLIIRKWYDALSG